jgi:phosphoadenosine phosphosulfate reductase
VTELARYRSETEGLAAPEILSWARNTFGRNAVTLASSFGAEDQVITHLLAEQTPDIPVFTLDTGRLHQETYDTMERTRERYRLGISVYAPDATQLEEMVDKHGPNLFRKSVDERKLCCHVRKVAPLSRALSGKRAWICGLRRAQSVTRHDLDCLSWDEANGLYKIAPLARWSEEQVWEFIQTHNVPYNALHDRGFRSIGCAPCTRAVAPGEDARAGRWWWEHPEHRECGLHTGNRPGASAPAGVEDRPTTPGPSATFGIEFIEPSGRSQEQASGSHP